MKIVVATDSFKGCMTSSEAGTIIAEAFRQQLPAADVVVVPMADGGEGTTAAVLAATGGVLRTFPVTGPLGAVVEASFGVLPDGDMAVMEMASASGLELVDPDDFDPLRATTFGTGELIRAVIDEGARRIVIGLGGSATVDGGSGMAQALGYRLLTAGGGEVGRGGGALATIERIDAGGVLPALAGCRIEIACDVTNPLLGEAGAARIFGPQKGATPAMVEALERGLGQLARVWQREGMLDDVGQPGDGAAGGLGAGLRAFCGAVRRSGAELVAELVGLDDAIAGADVVVTGEGRTDSQTAAGKLPVVVAAKARRAGARAVLVAGVVHGDLDGLDDCFDEVYGTVGVEVPAAEAIADGRANLAKAARRVAAELAG